MAHSVEAFRATLLDAAKELAFEQSQWRERKASIHLSEAKEQVVSSFNMGVFIKSMLKYCCLVWPRKLVSHARTDR